MNSKNLLSVYQSCNALTAYGNDALKKYGRLKPHEVRVLKSFCEIMIQNGCDVKQLDGFFISFSIGQIGKEFDLLRFGLNDVVNIELKSELKKTASENADKIYKQMRENFYYLKFLGVSITLFTFVENDGFYKFDISEDKIERTTADEVARVLIKQIVDESADPDKLFIPSNYLISPFNSTSSFIKGEYFLTNAQKKNKKEIKIELAEEPFKFFCLSANAGTGKTLLLYDIAKELISSGKRVLLIHCGYLNRGYSELNDKYGWNISSIKEVPYDDSKWFIDDFDFIFIDESQRIHVTQLNIIIQKALSLHIPVMFSYDINQYLKDGETTDIAEYLKCNFPFIPFSIKTLTNKIRTNKQMASFIHNLLEMGSSNDNLNYDCISIEYFDDINSMIAYINFLKERDWRPITYTTSSITPDPYDNISRIAETNAHAVIGQEFKKVVYVMDNNFKYNDHGKLMARGSYYSATGMLYQIVTRAIDELKIVVFNNPELYKNLMDIKDMSD